MLSSKIDQSNLKNIWTNELTCHQGLINLILNPRWIEISKYTFTNQRMWSVHMAKS